MALSWVDLCGKSLWRWLRSDAAAVSALSFIIRHLSFGFRHWPVRAASSWPRITESFEEPSFLRLLYCLLLNVSWAARDHPVDPGGQRVQQFGSKFGILPARARGHVERMIRILK